jgi:heterodisulfide reductase subunit C
MGISEIFSEALDYIYHQIIYKNCAKADKQILRHIIKNGKFYIWSYSIKEKAKATHVITGLSTTCAAESVTASQNLTGYLA